MSACSCHMMYIILLIDIVPAANANHTGSLAAILICTERLQYSDSILNEMVPEA